LPIERPLKLVPGFNAVTKLVLIAGPGIAEALPGPLPWQNEPVICPRKPGAVLDFSRTVPRGVGESDVAIACTGRTREDSDHLGGDRRDTGARHRSSQQHDGVARIGICFERFQLKPMGNSSVSLSVRGRRAPAAVQDGSQTDLEAAKSRKSKTSGTPDAAER
jgi:hypothetical protein